MIFSQEKTEKIRRVVDILQRDDLTPSSIKIEVTPSIWVCDYVSYGFVFSFVASNHPDFADLNKKIGIFEKNSKLAIFHGAPFLFSLEGVPLFSVSGIEEIQTENEEDAAKKIKLLLQKFIAEAANRNIRMCRDFIRGQLENLHSKLAVKDFYTYYRKDASLKDLYLKGRKNDLFEKIYGQSYHPMQNSRREISFSNILQQVDQKGYVLLKGEVIEVFAKGDLSQEEITNYKQDSQ